MTEPSPGEIIRSIEAAIEGGRLAEARQFLAQARTRLGALSELLEIEQRLAEIEAIALPEEVDGLRRRAQEAIQRADYTTALDALRRALSLRPGETDLRTQLEQVEKAAQRHAQSLERSQAVLRSAEEVGLYLDMGELEKARQLLREAGVTHGRHAAFDNLGQRLVELETQARQSQRNELLDRSQKLFENGNWRGVLQETERLLRLDPENTAARDLWQRARKEAESQETERQRRQALETAQHDIGRLIEAGELISAEQRLRSALSELGREEGFDELQRKLDRARSDLKFRQRVEWAERRANEAEGLLHEAHRLSLQGELAEAVQCLERAQGLDPSHPEIPDRLATAYAARDRQDEERQRAGHLVERIQTIRHLLESLRLTEAEALLQRTAEELGQDDRLVPLRQRLHRLQQGERGTAQLARIGTGEIDSRLTAELLRRQQESWAAYTWRQAFQFPLRDRALLATLALALVLTALDGLALVAPFGFVFGVMRLLLLIALLTLAPVLVRTGVQGKNHFPHPDHLLGATGWSRGGPRMAAVLLVLFLPLVLWLATQRWHHLLTGFWGSLGWCVAALLLWLACALGVFALATGATYGEAAYFHFGRHLKALATVPEPLMAVIHGCFGAIALWVLGRALLLPWQPWLAIPLLAVGEAYALVVLPHLLAVAMRREGILLAPVYG